MTEKKILTVKELYDVSGGVMRTVDTGMDVDAVVRSGPGMQYGQVGSIKNYTQVNTTGQAAFSSMDGRNWYEIDYPMYGWMEGTLIGYFL